MFNTKGISTEKRGNPHTTSNTSVLLFVKLSFKNAIAIYYMSLVYDWLTAKLAITLICNIYFDTVNVIFLFILLHGITVCVCVLIHRKMAV